VRPKAVPYHSAEAGYFAKKNKFLVVLAVDNAAPRGATALIGSYTLI